ncbi:MAG: SRPBCC family protein [Actinomycetota bacterium]|nr:SRPBCC family protein [Actinomycetota bacterium]
MATYETILTIPQSVEETFAFVSDFRNAALWDPRTYAVEKTTDGPIGVGTRFVLTGGMLREDLVRRFRLPQSVAGMPLPYDVVEFDAPHEFVLTGESRIIRYCDHLEFFPDGDGTRLRYTAELELKGPFALMEPFLRVMFKRIGDDATRDLPAAVAHRD